MRNGTFVQVGTCDEIVNHPADDYVSAFTKDVDRGRVLRVASAMTSADALPIEDASVIAAKTLMLQSGCAALHITDSRGKPIGVVTHRDLLDSANGERIAFSQLMRGQFPVIGEWAPLSDTFSLCSAGLPIAVVDAAGRLRGKVSANDVWAILAGRPCSTRPSGGAGSGQSRPSSASCTSEAATH